jgi:signal transduction histidine kinase
MCPAGLRLLSLVNDILDAAALQHRRFVLAQARVVLRPLVEEVADISRPLVRLFEQVAVCCSVFIVLYCTSKGGAAALGGGGG